MLKHSPIGKTCPYVLARASIHDKDNFYINAYCYISSKSAIMVHSYLNNVSEKNLSKLCNIKGHIKKGKICEKKQHVQPHPDNYYNDLTVYIDKSDVLKRSPIGKTCTYISARAVPQDKDNFYIRAYCHTDSTTYSMVLNDLNNISERDFGKLCNIKGHLKQGKICKEKRHVVVHKSTNRK